MHPDTFLRVLGPEPWRVAYVQPSRRPADGRYGDNPFRLGKHYQFQVILKPSPLDVQELYVRSLEAMGIDLTVHDLRFEEDNWEAPTLGAWGVGWQVMLDGMEITQFTYFQQAGGIELQPISARDHLRPRAHHDVPRARDSRSTTSTGCRAASTTARCATRTRSSSRSTTSRSPTSTSCAAARRLRARGAALPRSRAGAAGLRVRAQVLAPVQRARRARRGVGDRARRRS